MLFFVGHKKLSTTYSIYGGVSIAASRRGSMKGKQQQHDENAIRNGRRGDYGVRADALHVGGRGRRPHIWRSGAGAHEVVAGVEKEYGVEFEVAQGVEYVVVQNVELGALEMWEVVDKAVAVGTVDATELGDATVV